ncbi:RAB6-interacting golgin-like [Camellia sinensis]|uniref:RAB6-interacting golgin-like n=1 Tax=Camellia sinensis TaxID=4442 RepID=UPI001036F2EB|nr:RAB6-interacting golgin-like [Camellia sinensis]
MAKKNKVRALLTKTNRPEVPPPSQTQQAVVVLLSQQPSSSRPSKHARSTPTEQRLADEDETTPPPSHPPIPQPERSDRASSSKWAPKLKFQNRDIQDTNSSLQKSQIAHQKVLELRKTARQAMTEVEERTTELKESRQKTTELVAEVARLSELVTSAEADKQKALTMMKDKYLRELVKLEGKKDAEIAELKKKVDGANAEGFKEVKGLYIPQSRLEPTVEDLTVEPPTDTVLPVATETDLPSATGVQVDIEADLEDLFN